MDTDDPKYSTVAFFPWLIISEPVQIGTIHFIPFINGEGNISSKLADLSDIMPAMLSSYKDLEGNSISNCTIACMNNRQPPWGLYDNDIETMATMAKLLMLSAFAKNNYYASLDQCVNSSSFYPICQLFTVPPTDVALSKRCRYSRILDGGHKHGEINLSIPLQCTHSRNVDIDESFAEALGKSYLDGFQLVRRLVSALAFFSLANTDNETMELGAEIILMASAFEQLLGAESGYTLSCEMGELFKTYGSVCVDEALKSRPGIQLDKKYEPQQELWFLHRKWAEELYSLRSKFVHGDDIARRKWGWSVQEHLVFGAFIFPLVVKLCLAREGHYTLSKDDDIYCRAVDVLLGKTDWSQRVGTSNQDTIWQEAFKEVRDELRKQELLEKLQEYNWPEDDKTNE